MNNATSRPLELASTFKLDLIYMACCTEGLVGCAVVLASPLHVGQTADNSLWENYHDAKWCSDFTWCEYRKASAGLLLVAAIGFGLLLLLHVAVRNTKLALPIYLATALMLVFYLTGWALLLAAFVDLDTTDDIGISVKVGIAFWCISSLSFLRYGYQSAAKSSATEIIAEVQPGTSNIEFQYANAQMATQPTMSPFFGMFLHFTACYLGYPLSPLYVESGVYFTGLMYPTHLNLASYVF
ncbi:hypothetical protein CYMTET_23277 [Cymbomonas tetramitiformis]|uniref:Uncharacterized protein n=1 Tax=Cymbomonas tetramitiformis TaxID=36881 RepID=A0AAE0FZR1_9CHLO|nr:hypothetical protein CYMTET_23277 [Cymbomonas tetramitiformis]